MDPITCTIAFRGEAHERAADMLRELAGYEVTVEQRDGAHYDAFIGVGPTYEGSDRENPLRVNEENGQYEVLLSVTDEASELTGKTVWADIYDDIERLVVY